MRLAYLWSAITGYLTKTTGAIQGMFAWTSVADQLWNAFHVQVTYSKFTWLDVYIGHGQTSIQHVDMDQLYIGLPSAAANTVHDAKASPTCRSTATKPDQITPSHKTQRLF